MVTVYKCSEYDKTDGISIVEMYVNLNIYQDKEVNRPHTSSIFTSFNLCVMMNAFFHQLNE